MPTSEPEQSYDLLSREQQNQPIKINWQELFTHLSEYKNRLGVAVGILFAVAILFAPQGIASAQDMENFVCRIEETVLTATKDVSISCTDENNKQFTITLNYLISNLAISTYDQSQVDNPPSSTMDHVTAEFNPNYNCHSLTLQLLEERAGIDLGADKTVWLETGIDDLLKKFSQEIVVLEHFEQPQFGSNVVDPEVIEEGDIFVFYDGTGRLLHTATVIGKEETEGNEKLIQIENKLGLGQHILGTPGDIAAFYELGGEYEEEYGIGGGKIIVYRPNAELLKTAFTLQIDNEAGFSPSSTSPRPNQYESSAF